MEEFKKVEDWQSIYNSRLPNQRTGQRINRKPAHDILIIPLINLQKKESQWSVGPQVNCGPAGVAHLVCTEDGCWDGLGMGAHDD